LWYFGFASTRAAKSSTIFVSSGKVIFEPILPTANATVILDTYSALTKM
jgi:hypothetical protein